MFFTHTLTKMSFRQFSFQCSAWPLRGWAARPWCISTHMGWAFLRSLM